ncbi:MAG: SDR family oxidoreductase [Actinobacteria bacterium]|nr:SDR family oxidoreductase [Actinomycetota bacterium]
MEKVVVIISITSDIGIALAKRYIQMGYKVVGTYRSVELLSELENFDNLELFHCDIGSRNSIEEFVKKFTEMNLKWDLFISCTGTQNPVGAFFECDFDKWSDSIHINAIEQLRILHALYNYKNPKLIPGVVYFAGGGTNNAVYNYSAYTASKILLIKMCELLDFENKDMNIFIIGPGWVKTKIHLQTLEAGDRAGNNYQKTKKFMDDGGGTGMDDIFECIEWLIKQGKKISSGRNFSVVHDSWKGPESKNLVKELDDDYNMYKLRRYKNEWRKK